MKKIKTVVFDVDGALLDFSGAYIRFVHSRGHKHVNHNGIKNYLFLQDFGIGKEESLQLFKDFTDERHFGRLWPYVGVHDLIATLRNAGIKIIFATDVPTRAQEDRIMNLVDYSIKYDEIVFGPDKPAVVNKFNADLVLEDAPHHITDCLEKTEAQVAMVEWAYNKHIEHPRLINLGNPDVALPRLLSHLRPFL